MPDNASPAPSAAPAAVRFRALGSLDLQRVGVGELRTLLVQPKRLALFAYLLLARPPRLHRRDSLLALFWPESDAEHARRALRQALHFLRQALGSDVVAARGDDEVGVEPGTVWCDVHEFDRAMDDGRIDEALALYRGPLLEGFHAGAVSAELDQWIDAERMRAHARAVEAATQLANRAEQEGNAALAVQRLRDLMRLEPGAEGALRRLMALLDRSGDRAGALRAYEEFARRLAADVGAAPTGASTALAERIRAGRTTAAQAAVSPEIGSRAAVASAGASRRPTPAYVPAPVAPASSLMSASPLASKASVALPRPARAARPARWFATVAGTVFLAAIATFALRRDADERTGASASSLVLAIGSLGSHAGEDSSTTSRVLRDLVATDLARVSGITVVSGARMQELHLRLARGDSSRAAIMRTARAAGAQEVLEGELYRRSPEAMRLDVRRVELASGEIRRAYTVEASDLFTLVERLSRQVAAELGQAAPSPRLGRVTTTSLVAWKLYGEGRRALVRNDPYGALRLFEAALAEDSTFAMAAFWAAHVAGGIDGARQLPLLAGAMRASRHASPRDRLLVATAWAMATNDPASVTLADSLARGDSLDLESRLLFADALINAGQFERAITELNAIVVLDTADGPTSEQGDDTPCTACRALANLAQAYACLDSAAAGERVLRTWTRVRPRSAQAWGMLGATLATNGRSRAAEQAWEVWRSVAPPTSDLRLQRAALALRRGDFAAVDRQLADLARDGGRDWRAEAFWWQVISYRMQGRLDDALRAALQYRAQGDHPTSTLPQAQVMLERGRFREAARTFEAQAAMSLRSLYARLPAGTRDSAPGMQARAVAWPLTLAATAYALAGDTARLVALADTVALLGAQDAYWRDRVLHHHVRGLLWVARGRPEEAIAEFRRAIIVPTIGYSRSNLELGRLLIAARRPSEAIAVLEPALRGDLQASNYYVTHTELHEALAIALDAAGRPGEARPHWRWVANAWRFADAPFRERAARAGKRAGN